MIAIAVALVGAVGSACGEQLPAAVDSDAAASVPDGATSTTDAPASDASTCPSFADDFGRNSIDIANGWTEKSEVGGAVSVSMDAFRAETNAGGSVPMPTRAVLVKAIDPVPKSIRCTFKLKIETPNNDGYVDTISFQLHAADGTRSEVRLAIEQDSISIREDLHDVAGNCTACPATNQAKSSEKTVQGDWHTISFSIDANEAEVKRDDVIITSGSFARFPWVKASVSFGVVNFTPVAAIHSYDDLVCELGC